MAVITDEQRAHLQANTRFQQLAQMAIKNFAKFICDNDGSDPPGEPPNEMTQVQWARQRFIGKGVQLNPNSQDYSTWYAQMISFLKGADQWVAVADSDPAIALQKSTDATIDGMLGPDGTGGKLAELAELTFALRSEKIEF